MKKTGLFLTFLLLGLTMFAQYTGNKLPSGLTVADTANDADYTIIQKSGETYVKAIRMDSLRSYMTEGMAANVIELDSVAGNTGQFIISDGSGWLAPVSAKYEGSDAYTFGQRLSGAIGSGSIVLGRGRATAARSFTINGITASGTDAVAINGAIASGDRSAAINQGTASGDNSFAVGLGTVASGVSSVAFSEGSASGVRSFAVGSASEASATDAVAFSSGTASADYSTAWNSGIASGDQSTAWNAAVSSASSSTAWNSGTTSGSNATAWNSGISSGEYSTSWNYGNAQSYLETSFGQHVDTATTKTTDSWVVTDRLLTIGNGTGEGSESNALVMLKNGNTTANGNWTINGNITADTVTAYVMSQSSFGEIWAADGAVAQSIPNGTTYTKMTGFVRTGSYENMTPDSTNDKITITETGYYLVNITMSSICGTNGVVSRTAAFLGGVEQDQIQAMQTVSNTASPNPIACSGIIKVTTVPIDLDVRRRHDNGAPVNFTVVYANLTVHKLGGL